MSSICMRFCGCGVEVLADMGHGMTVAAAQVTCALHHNQVGSPTAFQAYSTSDNSASVVCSFGLVPQPVQCGCTVRLHSA